MHYQGEDIFLRLRQPWAAGFDCGLSDGQGGGADLGSPLDNHVVGKVRPELISHQLFQHRVLVLQIVPGQVVDLHVDIVLQQQSSLK